MGIAVKDSVRSPARISTRVAVGSARARATGSDQAGGSRPSHGRPGMAVPGTWISSAKTRLARRTIPWASIMQMAWVIASTVFSHSRFAEERSSTSRAFSRAMAAWASTAVTSVSSGLPKAPVRSLVSETAPTGRPAATSGAPSHDLGGSSVRSAPRRRASSFTLRAKARGPRRSASCSRGSCVRAGTALVSWVTASWFVSASSRTTVSRSGLSSSCNVRLTSSMTVAGRNAPASSWERLVSRANNSTAGRGVAALEGGLGMILANVRGRLRAQDFGRVDDQTYHYLVDMVGELTGVDEAGERGFLLRVHLGNYSLWLAGLFPDYVEARRSRQGGPDLPYYDELGRQGYRPASEHRLAERFGVAEIYRAAAQRFPTLRVAFNRLSDRVFFPHVSTPEKVLRNL